MTPTSNAMATSVQTSGIFQNTEAMAELTELLRRLRKNSRSGGSMVDSLPPQRRCAWASDRAIVAGWAPFASSFRENGRQERPRLPTDLDKSAERPFQQFAPFQVLLEQV